jgi:cation transport ATPase
VQLVLAWPLYASALRGLRYRKLTIEFFICLGTSVAYVASLTVLSVRIAAPAFTGTHVRLILVRLTV